MNAARSARRSRRRYAPLWAGALILLAIPIAFTILVLGAVSGAGATSPCGAKVRPVSVDIKGDDDVPGEGEPPKNFIPAYFAAADQPDAKLGLELGPYVLMAIHETESSFGRSDAPGVKEGINHVGDVSCCKGPFQFYDLPDQSTWRAYARDADGDGDADVYSNHDAMFAAAAYLHASGAPGDWRKAIYAYNNADWYVDQVLARAREFQAKVPPPSSASPSGPPASAVEVRATRYEDGDAKGYRGDRLEGAAAFAELGYAPGTNESNARTGRLGNLPYRARLRITYKGKTVEAIKLDVAEGGDAVDGSPPAIGLARRAADELRLKGDDVVSVARLDGGALPETKPAAVKNPPSSPGCAAPEGVEQVVNASDGGPYQVPLAATSYTPTGLFWEQREGYNHEGTDLAAPTGTPIFAAGAGKVVVAGWVDGYGNYTCIQHTQALTSCYGHQSKLSVEVGDTVQRGQRIGEVGSTGHSTGPHLHFEMRAGSDSDAPPQCPATYVGVSPAEWCAAGSPGFHA